MYPTHDGFKSISNVPVYEFNVTTEVKDQKASWYCQFRDPTWELPSIRSNVPRSLPIDFLVDETPQVHKSQLDSMPQFATGFELLEFIAAADNELNILLGTVKLNQRIREAISPFFPYYRRLQAVMRLVGAIVSGSFIVALLSGGPWSPNDIDIYLKSAANDRPLKIMLSFMLQSGFRLVSENVREYKPQNTIGRIFRFVNSLGRHVDIIECNTACVLDTIAQFHCSIVSNGLSSQHLLVMFPDWMAEKQALAPAALAKETKDKYEARGITFVHNNTDASGPCGTSCPSLVRSVARTGSCLLVPLSPTWLRTPDADMPLTAEWTSNIKCTNVKCPNCDVPGELRETLLEVEHED